MSWPNGSDILFLARGGMTMILVTHEMNFARRVATNVIYMRHGRVWETLPGAELMSPRTPELQEFIGHDN